MTDENLRSEVSDTIPEGVELFRREDGDIYGRDEHGEFAIKPMRGSPQPVEDRCGAVVTYTMERYGQTRYCTGMKESKFLEDGSDFCRLHKSKEALMEQAHELFKHGHFATNYINFVKHLSAEKFLFAVEMVGGLFEMSQHDFDVQTEARPIDTSDSEIIEEDTVEVGLPIPTKTSLSLQADQLWHAALAEVEMNNMREVVFKEGHTKDKIAKTADMEGKITDTKYEDVEHHLHLPISRLTTDIKKYLKNGGVAVDADESGVVTFQQNDYTLDVSPKETDSTDAESVSETAEDFTEQLTEAEAIEVE